MGTPFAAINSEFEIQRALGSGANGLVYLAKHTSGSLCALKEFSVSASVAQRFFREAAMVFTLVHDNVVRCLNLLYGKGGRSYLVFEYVEGGSLRECLFNRETLSVAESLDLVRQLCLGLHHAHDAGIIHCDLKPENILLQPSDHRITYKIADLGIARYQAELDETTGAPGSPAYMAPEQFYGRFDARTDLYALGVIFYEVLTGTRPFEGPPGALFLMHAQHAPDLSKVPDNQCARLISRLLAKQPASRPASAAAVLAEVEAIMTGTPACCHVEPAAITTVEPSDWPLAQTGPYSAERVILNQEFTSAQSMVGLFTEGTARILVNDGTSCDMVDLRSTRCRPHFLPETAVVSPIGDTVFATNRFIRSFDPHTSVSRSLFAHQTRVAAFSHDPHQERLLYANSRTLFCANYSGEIVWRADCRNYSRSPQLAITPTGEALISAGPIQPCVIAFDSVGRHLHTIPTNGPVLTLRDEGGDGRFSAVLQGLGADAPARFVIYQGNEIESQVEIGSGIFHAVWHGSLLSLHYIDGRIQLVDQTLTPVWEYRAGGLALADAWHPQLRIWCVLERHGQGVWLRAYSLVPLASLTPNQTVQP